MTGRCAMSADTHVETVPFTEVEVDEGGNQRLTHIVNCPDGKASTVAWLAEATFYGLEAEALCGHRWVPLRDPLRFPLCHPCIDAAGIILADVRGPR